MKIAKIISLLGVIAMTAVLIYGFTVGDFLREGSQLTAMPWGIVSLVDLYTGFILFSGWIIYREKSLPVAILWTSRHDDPGVLCRKLVCLHCPANQQKRLA